MTYLKNDMLPMEPKLRN